MKDLLENSREETETERKNLHNIEMQGTVITSIKCSIQIDTLGKECLSTGEGVKGLKWGMENASKFKFSSEPSLGKEKTQKSKVLF